MGSKANSKQAPVHWPRGITKAKLSPFLITSFFKKRGKKEIWTIFGKLGQVLTSLGKFGQVYTVQKDRKMGKRGRKNKKFEW